MHTIIAGSRQIDTMHAINVAVQHCPWRITSVVSGGARGVDSLAQYWAMHCGIPCVVMEAQWSEHGKSAGYIRNWQMAKVAQACLAIQCLPLGTPGTRHMISVARQHGLALYVMGFNPVSLEYELPFDLDHLPGGFP